MRNKIIYCTIVSLSVMLLLSCNKDNDTAIDFSINVQVPYDSTGIGGATYLVREYKGGGLMGPKKEYTDFEVKGTIDESGYDYVKFYPKKKHQISI